MQLTSQQVMETLCCMAQLFYRTINNKELNRSEIVHFLSELAYGKSVTVDGSFARLVLGASTALTSYEVSTC